MLTDFQILPDRHKIGTKFFCELHNMAKISDRLAVFPGVWKKHELELKPSLTMTHGSRHFRGIGICVRPRGLSALLGQQGVLGHLDGLDHTMQSLYRTVGVEAGSGEYGQLQDAHRCKENMKCCANSPGFV